MKILRLNLRTAIFSFVSRRQAWVALSQNRLIRDIRPSWSGRPFYGTLPSPKITVEILCTLAPYRSAALLWPRSARRTRSLAWMNRVSIQLVGANIGGFNNRAIFKSMKISLENSNSACFVEIKWLDRKHGEIAMLKATPCWIVCYPESNLQKSQRSVSMRETCWKSRCETVAISLKIIEVCFILTLQKSSSSYFFSETRHLLAFLPNSVSNLRVRTTLDTIICPREAHSENGTHE